MVYIGRDGSVTETQPGGAVAGASVWGVFNVLSLFLQTLFSPLSTEDFMMEQQGRSRIGGLNSRGTQTGGMTNFGQRSGQRLGGGRPSSNTGSNIRGMDNVKSCGGGGAAGGG